MSFNSKICSLFFSSHYCIHCSVKAHMHRLDVNQQGVTTTTCSSRTELLSSLLARRDSTNSPDFPAQINFRPSTLKSSPDLNIKLKPTKLVHESKGISLAFHRNKQILNQRNREGEVTVSVKTCLKHEFP